MTSQEIHSQSEVARESGDLINSLGLTTQYFDQADQIIQSNKLLVLRAQQLVELRSSLVK